jgi:hypothetical protein
MIRVVVPMAEGMLRRQIAQRDLAELPALTAADCAEMADGISDTSGRWGVQVTLLDITDIQVPLRGELLAWAQAQAGMQREKHPRE